MSDRVKCACGELVLPRTGKFFVMQSGRTRRYFAATIDCPKCKRIARSFGNQWSTGSAIRDATREWEKQKREENKENE